MFWTKFEIISSKIQMIKTTNADSAGRNNLSGGMDRPASADFPPAGGVWGGMRAGFLNLSFFVSEFRANETGTPAKIFIYLLFDYFSIHPARGQVVYYFLENTFSSFPALVLDVARCHLILSYR